jgi:hypothetical protein
MKVFPALVELQAMGLLMDIGSRYACKYLLYHENMDNTGKLGKNVLHQVGRRSVLSL